MIKIGFFGDGPWAHLAFDKLLNEAKTEIAFTCGRLGRRDEVLEEKSNFYNIPFLVHENINSEYFIDKVSAYQCNLFVSMSFDQIFRKALIDVPPLGVINCHAGKLPFYRGRNVLNWALINDEKEFGISVHYVDEGVDTGDLILQECFEITDQDNYATILERAHAGCASLLLRGIEDIISGKENRKTQKSIHPYGSYCSFRIAGDERLDWNQSSRRVFNFVRGICPPGPSAYCFRSEDKVKINEVEFLPEAPQYIGVPGVILAREGSRFLVKTADSYVRLINWEADIKLKVGDRLV